MCAITTRIERISALVSRHRIGVPPRGDVDRSELFLDPVWADCIIATMSLPESGGLRLLPNHRSSLLALRTILRFSAALPHSDITIRGALPAIPGLSCRERSRV
jgi:hypothetical protein